LGFFVLLAGRKLEQKSFDQFRFLLSASFPAEVSNAYAALRRVTQKENLLTVVSVSDTVLHLWNVMGVTLAVSEPTVPHVWRVFRKSVKQGEIMPVSSIVTMG